MYMLIDIDDEFELPLAIADSASELARMVGVSPNTIKSATSAVKHGRVKRSRYIYVDDTDET